MYTIKSIILLLAASSCFAGTEYCERTSDYDRAAYEDMRQAVLDEGWVPDIKKAKTYHVSGEGTDIDVGHYNELAFCMPTSEGNCFFLFKRDDKTMEIATYDRPALVKYLEVCGGKNVA